jgi:hypothetical protein
LQFWFNRTALQFCGAVLFGFIQNAIRYGLNEFGSKDMQFGCGLDQMNTPLYNGHI